MAKIIEFYIPSDFRRKTNWIPAEQRGKVIEFRSPTRKSASTASASPVQAAASSL